MKKRGQIELYISIMILFLLNPVSLSTSYVINDINVNQQQIPTTNDNMLGDPSPLVIPPDVEWVQSYGIIEQSDYGKAVQEIEGEGYILLGESYIPSKGNYDIWLIKTDYYGNEIWNQTLGGGGRDLAYDIKQTTDNGFIITGESDSYTADGRKKIWVVRTDEFGNELWNKSIFNIQFSFGRGYSIQQCNDRGFILTGWVYVSGTSISKDLFVVKTDEYGNETWNRTYNGGHYRYNYDAGHSVQQTKDNGFIVTGIANSNSQYTSYGDLWLIKLDADGNESWKKIHAQQGTYMKGIHVQQTFDEGYIITGNIDTYWYPNIFLMKTDKYGDILWTREYGIFSKYDYANYVNQITDGFIIAGTTSSYAEIGNSFWIIRTNNTGIEYWNLSIEYGGYQGSEFCSGAYHTSDNGIIIVGDFRQWNPSDNEAVLVKVKPENRPPTIDDIPDQTIAQEQFFTSINLDDYISDPDDNDSDIQWIVTPAENLTIDIDENRIAHIKSNSPLWIGSETVTFIASDPAEWIVTDQVTFTMYPIPIFDITVHGIGELNLLETQLSVRNVGGMDGQNIEWSINLTGGTILTGETSHGVLNISSGMVRIIRSNPIIGFGRSRALISIGIPNTDFQATKEAEILLLFLFQIVLEG